MRIFSFDRTFAGPLISEDKIREIRERTDVVALIGEFVPLKRAGAQFKGLCPFHAEKSPSFHVHPERQFWKCFGCGAAGDSIAFVQKLEGRSFAEAVRMLAERSGIELAPEDEREDIAVRQARLERERWNAITETAAGYFIAMLAEHPLGKVAQGEIESRGVTRETATTYRLGYAPFGWDGLAKVLAQKGFSARDAEIAGVLIPRKQGDGHYDRFRHRLMFPIADVHGRIVAFSGRALPPPTHEPLREGQDPPAKYVNSPEGPLYKKGELLFGLHEARVALRREGTAILCEGNFDVLALHQAGMRNVVAPLGTAFTAQQAKLLRRYVSKVTVVFDGDRAGRKAVLNAFPLLAAESLPARVAPLPAGEDPDSFLRAHGDDALRRLVDGASPILDNLIDTAALDAGADPSAKARAIEELGPLIGLVASPVERRLWVERVARAFEMTDVEAVSRQLRRGWRAARSNVRPDRQMPTPTDRGPTPSVAREEKSARADLPEVETELVGLLLDQPQLMTRELGTADSLLTSNELRAILQSAARMVESGDLSAVSLLSDIGETPAKSWLESRLSVQVWTDPTSAEQQLHGVLIPKIRLDDIARRRAALKQQISRALTSGDMALATSLTQERDQLGRDAVRIGRSPSGSDLSKG